MIKLSLIRGMVIILTFFCMTSCNDSLEFDSRENCNGCADPSPRSVTNAGPSLAADSWLRIKDFPGVPNVTTRRMWAVSFNIDGTAYVGTGQNGGFSEPIVNTKDLWRYDQSLNAWTQMADFGGEARNGATAFSIGQKGYIGTGINSTTVLKDFWEYDPSTNAWTRKADFGGIGRRNAVGMDMGTKGYIGLGIPQRSPDIIDFWEYDPSTDVWTRKADFRGPGRGSAISFVLDSRNGPLGYVGGGFSSAGVFQDFWQYFPASDIWRQRANVPENRQVNGFFSIGSKGYAALSSNRLWMFDPLVSQPGAWVEKASFPGEGSISAGVGFSSGGRGYIGLGNSSFGSADGRAFYQYTPE